MTDAATIQVQSVRNVKAVRGYPYYAYGVYVARPRVRDGVYTFRLVRSGPAFRSDVNGRTRFDGIPVVPGVRHGKPVPSAVS